MRLIQVTAYLFEIMVNEIFVESIIIYKNIRLGLGLDPLIVTMVI